MPKPEASLPPERTFARKSPRALPNEEPAATTQQQQMAPKQTAEDLRREVLAKIEQEAIAAPSAIGSGSGSGAAAPLTLPYLPSQGQAGAQQQAPIIQAALPEAAEPTSAKLAFLESAREKLPDHYLRAMRTAQISPYEIKAGWEIPAILEQSLNSDIPGEVKAMVREHIYDTATGRYLLIPQGSRVIGRYNSRVDYGQDGLQIVWDRVLYPDGSSLSLGGMNGMDAQGRAGLRHDVDNHYKKIFGTAALTSLFSAALALTQSRQQSFYAYPSPSDMATSAVAREMAMTGQQITRKNLNIPPTIKVPLGYTFTVRVNKDILFDGPYRDSRQSKPTDLPSARGPSVAGGR
jgi:type IV secretion system protein VirB10